MEVSQHLAPVDRKSPRSPKPTSPIPAANLAAPSRMSKDPGAHLLLVPSEFHPLFLFFLGKGEAKQWYRMRSGAGLITSPRKRKTSQEV